MIDETTLAWLQVVIDEARLAHRDLREDRVGAACARLELVIGILSPYVESRDELEAWRREIRCS